MLQHACHFTVHTFLTSPKQLRYHCHTCNHICHYISSFPETSTANTGVSSSDLGLKELEVNPFVLAFIAEKRERERDRQRERDRERETERERERERIQRELVEKEESDREQNRQTDRQSETENRDRLRETVRERQTHREERGRDTLKQRKTDRDRHTGRCAHLAGTMQEG